MATLKCPHCDSTKIERRSMDTKPQIPGGPPQSVVVCCEQGHVLGVDHSPVLNYLTNEIHQLIGQIQHSMTKR